MGNNNYVYCYLCFQFKNYFLVKQTITDYYKKKFKFFPKEKFIKLQFVL